MGRGCLHGWNGTHGTCDIAVTSHEYRIILDDYVLLFDRLQQSTGEFFLNKTTCHRFRIISEWLDEDVIFTSLASEVTSPQSHRAHPRCKQKRYLSLWHTPSLYQIFVKCVRLLSGWGSACLPSASCVLLSPCWDQLSPSSRQKLVLHNTSQISLNSTAFQCR